MQYQLKNVDTNYLYCTMRTSIVPQIGSHVRISGSGNYLEVIYVTYCLYPFSDDIDSSDDTDCVVWVKNTNFKI